MTRYLAPLLLIACSSVTSTDRAKTADYAIEALRTVCPYYERSPEQWRRSPELDAICPVLLGKPVAPEVPIVDAGGDRDGG